MNLAELGGEWAMLYELRGSTWPPIARQVFGRVTEQIHDGVHLPVWRSVRTLHVHLSDNSEGLVNDFQ